MTDICRFKCFINAVLQFLSIESKVNTKLYLIEIVNVSHLSIKNEFAKISSGTSGKHECPTISRIALNVLLPFSTTHLCEATFVAFTIIK